jgi:hypothetical protein
LCSGLGSPNIANLVSPLAAVFPIITQQPQSVTVNAGSSFNLIVQATSSASNNSNLSYQWFKDGVAKDGFTTQNYFIFSATAADAGSYTVAVTDSLGTATSNPAVVTVNPAPAPPSSGGGGGAPSYWFYLALAVLLAIRKGLGTKKRDCAIQSR